MGKSRHAYARLLPYAFKLFSIKKAVRTAVPTAGYYLQRPALPPSDKPALFTMNILPPMMTVWHYFVKKNLGDAVDVTIFDCSGSLQANEFPGARVQKMLNFYAATKSDEFLYHVAKNRSIGWICDDDVFFTGSNVLPVLQQEFAVPNTASVSFRPRDWWHFEMNGKQIPPSGSYCIAFDRNIVVEKEHLSFRPEDGNTHPSHNGKGERRYDTGDRMNELLLEKGYRCAIVPEQERSKSIAAFTGMSGAVILLDYFKKPEDVMAYLTAPADVQWRGSVLFGLLSSLLAIHTIQDLYTKIRGTPYLLPSLPSRMDIEKLRREKAARIGEGRSFDWVDRVSEKLFAAL